MRRHAKASSAGPNSCGGSGLGSVHRAFAARGASAGSPGRVASSRRLAAALAAAILALLVFAPSSPARLVVNGYGTTGTLGGQFTLEAGIRGGASGIGVNRTGAGGVAPGTFYVADTNVEGRRITRFSPSGAFERTWGQDVVIGGSTGFEICTVASECKEGSFSSETENGGFVSFGIPLIGLSVSQVTGDVYILDRADRISEFDANGNFIRLWGWDVVMSGRPNDKGTDAFEVCDTTAGNVPTDCKSGIAGNFPSLNRVGKIGGRAGVPEIDTAGNVWFPDAFGRRLVEFSATGELLKAVGTDVIVDGAEGTGTIATGSKTVTSVVTTKRYFQGGQTITGSGIPAGTKIESVSEDEETLTLSKEATEAGSRTLTVAEGAGNIPSNERQKVSFVGSPSGGAFALSFHGETTGGVGSGTATTESNVLTGVNTTSGSFKVGQLITGRPGANPDSVLAPGTTITAVGPTTLTLSKPVLAANTPTFLKSYDLPYNASAGQVQSALNSLSTIGGIGGAVSVTGSAGGPYTVEFIGTRFSGADVPFVIGVTTEGITPSVSSTVTPENPNALETCTVFSDCRIGVPGTAPGQVSEDGDINRIAFDSGGNLYMIDAGNARVTKYNPALTSASVFAKPTLDAFTRSGVAAIAPTQEGNRLAFAVNNNVSASPPEMQIIEVDLSGAPIDSSLVGLRLNDVTDLDENWATGTLYATTRDVVGENSSPRGVLALRSALPPDPVIALDPITVKTGATATFSGTVDPTGGLVTCAFEYSEDQVSWTSLVEPDCDSLSPGGGAQAVSQVATGLIPHTHYFVRLAVSRTLVLNSTKRTAVREFDTDQVVPVVDNVSPLQIQDKSARIVARIDPRHSQTSYVIQYGLTAGLGSTTDPVDIGSGTVPQILSRTVDGLTPATKYFYKVVAENQAGLGESPIQSFTTREVPLPLPDGRRYEMVSPLEKGYAPIDNVAKNIIGPNATVAEDGNAISYCTGSIFGPDPAAYGFPPCGWNVMHRTSTGWKTRSVIPPFCVFDHVDVQSGIPFSNAVGFDRNVDKAVFYRPDLAGCPTGPLDPAAPSPQTNLYRTNLLEQSPNYSLLTPGFQFNPNYGGQLGIEFAFYGGSSDFSHLVFTDSAKLTPDAPEGAFMKVYDWDEGVLHLVSINPAGVPFTNSAAPVLNAWAHNGISSDGSRILFTFQTLLNPTNCFTIPANNCHIYMRENNSVTYDVSASECTTAPCPATASGFFKRGTPDLSSVFFASKFRLTNNTDSTLVGNAGGFDLYVFKPSEHPATDPNNLTLLTKDNEPADGSEAKAETVLGTNTDGTVVYFATEGQIVSGAPTSPGHKVYRWQWNGGSPTVEYLFMLPLEGREQALNWYRPIGEGSFEPSLGGAASPNQGTTMPRLVSDDGKYVLIQSYARLVPGVDYDSDVDYYRWGVGEGLVCVSCQAPGVPSKGPSYTGLASTPNSFQIAANAQPPQASMSVNGQKIFFNSRDALVPGDENGSRQDVYEWNEGTLSLISSGRSTDEKGSYLVGVSKNADDVFFVADDKFVGWDTDILKDLYDARVGGGFPEPPATPAECEGEACRGAGSSSGALVNAGSAVFEGPGNERVRSVTCRKGLVKKFVNGREVCRRTKRHPHPKHPAKKAGHRTGAGR